MQSTSASCRAQIVQGADLVAALGLLMQEVRDQSGLGDDPLPQAALRDVVEMPTQVAQNPASIALELFQRLAHALELPGMGVAAHLQRETRGARRA